VPAGNGLFTWEQQHLVQLPHAQCRDCCASAISSTHSNKLTQTISSVLCSGYLHDKRKAQKAAYRRAADLLQACGAARRRHEGAAAADGAYEGALGLTRKLHYTGYVQVRVRVQVVVGWLA
jgi:hypothetical protein